MKLLGLTIDRQLKFDKHVFDICTKAGRKLSALTRMISYLTFYNKMRLLKTFFESQFKYCSLTWMFHSRELNNRINRHRKRALKLIYNDFTTSLEQLLDKDNSFTIHQQNIQSLVIEMYKVANGLSTNLFSEIFAKNEATNHFRSKSDFIIPKVRTELYGKMYT